MLGDFDGAWERDSTNVEAVLKQLVANRPTDDWDDSWIWKGEFFDDTLVNGVATLLFGGHPVYVTSKIGLISERHNAWWSSRGLKRVDCQLHVPDVVMLHLARKNEPHEGILGEWVKRSNVCCSPVHPTPTAVALSVINHNWPTVEAGEKTKKNSKCGSFSLSISFHNRTVLRDLRVQQVARNEFYLAMDADREPPNFCQIFWQFFGHFGENLRFYQGVLSERGIWLSGPIRITLRNSTLSII